MIDGFQIQEKIIHGVPGFVLVGESGEVIEVAGVCQTSLASRHPPMEWGAIWKDAQDRYLPKWSSETTTLLPIHHGVFVRKLSTPVPSINCYEKTPWKTNMTGWSFPTI